MIFVGKHNTGVQQFVKRLHRLNISIEVGATHRIHGVEPDIESLFYPENTVDIKTVCVPQYKFVSTEFFFPCFGAAPVCFRQRVVRKPAVVNYFWYHIHLPVNSLSMEAGLFKAGGRMKAVVTGLRRLIIK
ncbi:MAG: hypothetical protein LBB47_01155 [Spirochaetaceae bacterium]|nr:hypothetical protein [Spirochaetaceae bacterium]